MRLALYVTFRLKTKDEVCEEAVFMGEIPLITSRALCHSMAPNA